VYFVFKEEVSIHAPTRGATSGFWTLGAGRSVSIHAPTRGATKRGRGEKLEKHVSIHAPTRGATFNLFRRGFNELRFNPRPHAGGDRKICLKKEVLKRILCLTNYRLLDNVGLAFKNARSPVRTSYAFYVHLGFASMLYDQISCKINARLYAYMDNSLRIVIT